MHNFSQSGRAELDYGSAGKPSVYSARNASILKDQSEPLSVAFLFCAGLAFIRFSLVGEILTYVTHHNFYLLYVFGLPATIALVVSGGLARVLRRQPTILWMCFGLWAVAAIPFSLWKGGSFHAVFNYWKAELLMLFVIGGLTKTVRECKALMLTIAGAAAVSLLWTRIFLKTTDTSGRLTLEVGSISNANDFAGFLLLAVPFIVWVTMSSRSIFMRVIALGAVGYGVYVILASGSRGALVALAAELLFFAFAAKRRHRVTLWLAAPVILLVAVIALPDTVVTRLTSFTASKGASREALESSQMRERLLKDAVNAAIEHPLFGIGPGQFTLYEGTVLKGNTRGTFWFGAHNSYAQAASECGIPVLIFFLAAVWSTWRLLTATGEAARQAPHLAPIANAVFCAKLSMIGFCIAIFFINFAYTFYLPAMTGIAIALASAAQLPQGQQTGAS